MYSPTAAPLHDQRFDDAEDMASYLAGWDLDLLQIAPGAFQGSHRVFAWPGVLLNEGRTAPSLIQRGGGPSHPTFCVFGETGQRMILRGREHRDDSIVVVRPGEEIHLRTDAGFHMYTLTVEEGLLRSVAREAGSEVAVDAVLACRSVPCSQPGLARLRRALRVATGSHEGRSRNPQPGRALVHTLCRVLASAVLPGAAHDLRQLDRVAMQVEAVFDARPRDALTVGTLCDAVGVSERTLRRAVQTWYGISPKQLDRTRRLHAVRRDLKVTHADATGVTSMALAWGFSHLGRFAGDYKNLFGERPSETLARDRMADQELRSG